ncbi:peptide chain release factor N(5)-glutamine methyltransferase [bacterium]|nr:peptide chain release factor N(5)-glutamine methyltransferase [bacterium]
MALLSVGELVLKSAEYLQKKGVDSPRLDAELLLAKIMGCDRLRLYLDWKKPLTELEVAAYRDFIRRRGQDREPVARIVGSKSFYGRDFEVTRDSFVPRPETETLVEKVLDILKTEPALHKGRQVIFEIGTGTGCIIVSLAAESDSHRYLATDILPGALAVAKRNARKHGVEQRIEFRQGRLLADYEGTIGVLVSNPPYIESPVIPTLDPEVKNFDPMEALDGGLDGLDVLRSIVELSVRHLQTGGWVALELGEDQPKAAAALFKATGCFSEIRQERDLAGLLRFLFARKS